jgi:ribosomal protein S18 acetylase RimI-like enzyme
VLDVRRAERALHCRAGLACGAALDAGVPGRFRVWRAGDVMAVLASDPALGFLSVVSGVTRETVPTAIDLVNAPVWSGVRPTVVVSTELGETGEGLLLAAGLTRTEDRILAVTRFDDRFVSGAEVDGDVSDPGANDAFVDVLLAGYEVDGVVASFLAAEHRLSVMRRFFVIERDAPIAAGAMTIHDDVAVLGGASTLPGYRHQGAQSRLLRHRLRVAAQAGCRLAVATARPESVSAANLRRAGFRIHRRAAWTKTSRGHPRLVG